MKTEIMKTEISKEDIEHARETFLTKYNAFMNFFTVEDLNSIFQQAVNEATNGQEDNSSFLISFLAERNFLLRARDMILEGNIELEILFVEKYINTAQFLLRQIKYKGNDSDKLAEEGIIQTIENYNGELSFKRDLLATLRDLINPKKEIVTQHKQDILKEENKEELSLDVPSDEVIRMPNQLEMLIREADILKKIPLDDPLYVKFVTLKYGYHQNQYYDIAEISQILSIPIEQATSYYQQTLQFVKDWFGVQLDKVYTYCTQKSE